MSFEKSQMPAEDASFFDGFPSITELLNGRLEEAIVLTANEDQYRYFTVKTTEEPHPLAVFALDVSVEMQRQRSGDPLGFAIPLRSPNTTSPKSILGKQLDAYYFDFTYFSKRGDEETFRLNENTYALWRNQKRLAVRDLAQRILTYTLMPMREK